MNLPQHSHTSRPRKRAFSLVEVVVAVGIFAIAIISIIGLVGPIAQSVSDVSERDDAGRLATTLQGELQRLPFSFVVGAISSPPAAGIFASRDGSKIGVGSNNALWQADGLTGADADALKFFEVIIERNATLSPAANDATAGFMAINVTLRWPAHLGNGQRVTDPSVQNSLLVPMAITR